MIFSKRDKIKKLLRETIRQGYNEDIQKLFDDIVGISREEFNEDNLPTIASFLVENLFKALCKHEEDAAMIVKDAMISGLNEISKKE